MQLKRPPIVASLLASFTLLVLGACNSNRASTKSSDPPSLLAIARFTDLGVIPTNPDIRGRDGAFSALIQGKSVWVYASTFLSKPNMQGRMLISNSWSFTEDLNAQDGISGFHENLDSNGTPTMLLPETPAEEAFDQAHNSNQCKAQPCGAMWALWPSSIVANWADNRAVVFYSVVSELPGNFNFQSIGSSAAIWQNLQQQPQRPAPTPTLVASHPDLLFRENEPSFGSAAFISDNTLYVYGCGMPTDGLDKGCRLGKVDPSRVQDRSAWTFYAGKGGWSSQTMDAVPVFSGNNNLSISWNNYLQTYIAVYSQPFSQNVVLRTSPHPEGPWSAESVAFVAMRPIHGNVYDAHSHSEYDHNGGQTIFVTYSRQTANFSSEVRLVSLTLRRRS